MGSTVYFGGGMKQAERPKDERQSQSSTLVDQRHLSFAPTSTLIRKEKILGYAPSHACKGSIGGQESVGDNEINNLGKGPPVRIQPSRPFRRDFGADSSRLLRSLCWRRCPRFQSSRPIELADSSCVLRTRYLRKL